MIRRFLVPILVAAAALAAWPAFIAQRSAGDAYAQPTPAPVYRDDLHRNEQVAFWERAAGLHDPIDFVTPRMLAGEYMQRYRERGDIGDVVRALAMAQREQRVVPHSVQGDVTMVPPLLTLHRFSDALGYVNDALRTSPTQSDLLTREAGLLMELGRYREAGAALERARKLPPSVDDGVDLDTITSRYDELTGDVASARSLLQRADVKYEAYDITAPIQSRAWYHYRLGELAFESGDNAGALAEEHKALDLFPTYNLAATALARFELALHEPRAALDAAQRAAAVVPLPETLGYMADAQTALGDTHGAAATADLIEAIERIGNAYRVNDRLIALFYAEHGLHGDDALRMARRDALVRGDEIYAQDTLAWTAAMDGHWSEARRAMARAIRFDAADPRVQFHAGMIALHFGDRAEAKRRLTRALALNPQFHPVYAGEARATLARL